MRHAYRNTYLTCLAAAAFCLSGCTSFPDYIQHGFKVGPDYSPPKATVAPRWIDAADIRVRSHAADLSRWWCVFNDPTLNDLVYHAYQPEPDFERRGYADPAGPGFAGICQGRDFPPDAKRHGQL